MTTPHDEIARLESELRRLREEFHTVSSLGMRLSRELNPATLLPAILTEARRFTRSEAGTLYVRDGNELEFRVTQNDALDSDQDGEIDAPPTFKLPIDGNSLAGLAALKKQPLNIRDARDHASFSRAARDKFAYEVRSMLVLPMVDPDGDVLGVLQLMNAKDAAGAITAYSDGAAELCQILASHAATALAIANLHAELREVFDSLVNYTATAIDARDPCTAGHSSRVSAYSVRLARELGGFTEAELREIRFAGMFHDVGKIGVRECVLTKADKIPPEGMAAVTHRYYAACEAALARGWEAAQGDPSHDAIVAARRRCDGLLDDLAFLEKVKDPSWLSDADLERLQRIGSERWMDFREREHAFITEDELDKLAVRKGNLTEKERAEIQSHVQLSWEFLRQVPFPSDLARVPELAWSHHERMDGSGYPRGISGDAIPLAARILTVADVFDALTAEDRPYKKSMTPERALAIVEHEGQAGAYDMTVVAALRRLVEAGRLVPRGHAHGADERPFDASRDAW